MRNMGGLRTRMPLTYVTFLIAALAISGFPLLSGFYSKDEIISLAFTSPRGSVILGVIALFTAGLTAVYIFRVVFVTFHGKSRVSHHLSEHLHEPGMAMALPLVILAVLAAIGGYVQFPGEGFVDFLQPSFSTFGVTPAVEQGLNVGLAAASIVLSVGGILIAYLIWGQSLVTAENLGKMFAPIRTVLLNDYGIDALYSMTIVALARGLGRLFADIFDGLILNGIIDSLAGLVSGLSVVIAKLETGYVRSYAVAVLAGAILIVAFMARGGL